MAAQNDQPALLRGTETLTSWYDCSRPMWIDLVGDYAGRELFLVEGDSLLRECFEDDRIDFKGKAMRLQFYFTCYPRDVLNLYDFGCLQSVQC